MAGPHMGGGQQALPQVQRDPKRPWTQDKKRTTINKDNDRKWQQRQQQKRQSNSPPLADYQAKGGNHQNLQPQWQGRVPDVHQPDRKIPKEIKLQLPVHNDTDRDWQQWNPRGSHERPLGRWDDSHIAGACGTPLQHRSYSKDAHFRQWVLYRVQGKNQTQQHEVSACTSTRPQVDILEKAIKVVKAHFISILCSSADKSFPLHLWDRLLGQAEHTLNMLWTSRMMPLVSEYAYLWGKHDYNANPFAPLECKVKAHITPSKQETWAPHTTSGFYISNACKHYRCHKIYICDTNHTRTCLGAFFKHKYLTMPTITPANALICAADYLPDAILALIQATTCTQDAVDQLMVIFNQRACAANDAATAQRVLREHAQAERVIKEEQPTHVRQESAQTQVTPSQSFEIKENNGIGDTPQGIPQITQGKYDSLPAANMRQQRETRPSHRN